MRVFKNFVKLKGQTGFLLVSQRFQHSLTRKKGWESAVGLEVHAQIDTKTKIFSRAPVSYGAPVNTQVDIFDAAIPGTLPALSRATVEAAVLTSLALSCQVNQFSTFDRKHYFYADLPAGYQITQQRNPIAKNGLLDFIVYSPSVHKAPYTKSCKIRQLQLEHDSGKSLHDADAQRSLIDLNRAGIALMEIVFEPNLQDGEEAGALVKELILILQRIKTCNCRMEEGSLRVDANISVNRVGDPLGVRTEIKNLGSIRSVVHSIEYEVQRQIKELEAGGEIINETRSFDAERKITVPMRDKEMKQDYRFMPEPNLPPLRLTYDPLESNKSLVNVALMRKRLVELPEVTRKRLVKRYGLRLPAAIILVNFPGMLKFFNAVMEAKSEESGPRVCNILQGPLQELLNEENIEWDQCHVRPADVAHIVTCLETEVINSAQAELILKKLMSHDQRTAQQIIAEENMVQVTDDEAIKKLCLDIMEKNPKLVKGFKEKDESKFLKKLLGALNAAGDGKLNMKKATEIMKNLLKNK